MFTLLPLTTIFYVTKPFVAGIVSDIIMSRPTDQTLIDTKIKLCQFITSITKKSHIFFDTEINRVIDLIMSDYEAFNEHGEQLLDCIETWVNSEHTHYNAARAKPMLDCFRLAVYNVPTDAIRITHPADEVRADIWRSSITA